MMIRPHKHETSYPEVTLHLCPQKRIVGTRDDDDE